MLCLHTKKYKKIMKKHKKRGLTYPFFYVKLRISLKERRKTMNFMALIISIILISIILLVLVIMSIRMNSVYCVAGNELSSTFFARVS